MKNEGAVNPEPSALCKWYRQWKCSWHVFIYVENKPLVATIQKTSWIDDNRVSNSKEKSKCRLGYILFYITGYKQIRKSRELRMGLESLEWVAWSPVRKGRNIILWNWHQQKLKLVLHLWRHFCKGRDYNTVDGRKFSNTTTPSTSTDFQILQHCRRPQIFKYYNTVDGRRFSNTTTPSAATDFKILQHRRQPQIFK